MCDSCVLVQARNFARNIKNGLDYFYDHFSYNALFSEIWIGWIDFLNCFSHNRSHLLSPSRCCIDLHKLNMSCASANGVGQVTNYSR